ncbi:MAG: hypothetical protein LBD17_01560, partial [Endomicrobium sp.]|nr:hypothetical protein [Endomicrobium sp.]
MTAYNAINNTSKTLGDIGSEKILDDLDGWWSNGGTFFGRPADDNGKRQMFEEIVYAISSNNKPVVVYGKG